MAYAPVKLEDLKRGAILYTKIGDNDEYKRYTYKGLMMDFIDKGPLRLTINADNTISIYEELGEYVLLKKQGGGKRRQTARRNRHRRTSRTRV